MADAADAGATQVRGYTPRAIKHANDPLPSSVAGRAATLLRLRGDNWLATQVERASADHQKTLKPKESQMGATGVSASPGARFDQHLSAVDAEFEASRHHPVTELGSESQGAQRAPSRHNEQSSIPYASAGGYIFALGVGTESAAAAFREPHRRRSSAQSHTGPPNTNKGGAGQTSSTSADVSSSAQPLAHTQDDGAKAAGAAGSRLTRQDSSLRQAMQDTEQKEQQLTNKQVREQLLQHLAEPRSLKGAASLASNLHRRQRKARLVRASAKSGQTLLSQVPANIKCGRATKAGVRRILGSGSQGRGGPTAGVRDAHLTHTGSSTGADDRSASQSYLSRRQIEDAPPTAEQLARHILSQISQSTGQHKAQTSTSPHRDSSSNAASVGITANTGMDTDEAVASITDALHSMHLPSTEPHNAVGTDLDSTGVVTALLHKLAADPLVPLSRPDMMLTAQELAASQVGQYIAQYVTRSAGIGSSDAQSRRRRQRATREGGKSGENVKYASDSGSSAGSSTAASDSGSEEWEVQEERAEDGTVLRKLVPASNAGAVERRRRRTARADRKRSLMRTADSIRSTEPMWGETRDGAMYASATDRAIARISQRNPAQQAGRGGRGGAQTPLGQLALTPGAGSRDRNHATPRLRQPAAEPVLSPLAVAHTLAFSSIREARDRGRAPSAMSSASRGSASRSQYARTQGDPDSRWGEALVQVNTVADMAAVEAMLSTRSPRSGRLVGTAAHGRRNATGRGRGLINSGFVALAASETAAAAASRRGEAAKSPFAHLGPDSAPGESSVPQNREHTLGKPARLSAFALHHASEQAAHSLAHERKTVQLKAEKNFVSVPVRALRRMAKEATEPKSLITVELQQVSETALVFRDAEEHASAEAARQDRAQRMASLKRAKEAQKSSVRSLQAEPQDSAATAPTTSGSRSPSFTLSAPKSTSLQRALEAARSSAADKAAAQAQAAEALPATIRTIGEAAESARSVEFNVVAAAAKAQKRQQTLRRGEQLEESMSHVRPSRNKHSSKPWRQRGVARKRSLRAASRQGASSTSSEFSRAPGAMSPTPPNTPTPQSPPIFVPPLSLGLISAQSSMHNTSDDVVHAHLNCAVQRMRAFQRLTQQAHERHETAVEFTSMVGAGAATALTPLRSYVEHMSDGWGRVACTTARVHMGRERLARAADEYTMASSARGASQSPSSDAGRAGYSATKWAGSGGLAARPGASTSLRNLQSAAAALSSQQQRLAAADFNHSAAGTEANGTRSKYWQRHGGVRQVALQHLGASATARRQRMLDHLNEMEAQGIPLPVDSSVGCVAE